MDNADSSPAITFPNVPDDFCPTGNWQNVFQVFIDEVLSNGTILVPGLGDVTPQQIAQINEQLANQQNEIDALGTRVTALEPAVKARYGNIGSIPAGDSIQTVSFAALPSATYGISITPNCNATIGTSATPLFAIVDGSKTTTGFSIRVENNISQITQIDWVAIYSA
jgi:hypothetical protein